MSRSSRTNSTGYSSSASSRLMTPSTSTRAAVLDTATPPDENDASDDTTLHPAALTDTGNSDAPSLPIQPHEDSLSDSLGSPERTYPSDPGPPFDSIDPDLVDMGHTLITTLESLLIEQRPTREDFLASGGLEQEIAAPTNFLCLICQESEALGGTIVRLHGADGHEFCSECIHGWLQNHNTCPKCRHELFIKEPEKEPLMLETYNPVPARNDDDFVDWVAGLVSDDHIGLIRPATHSAMFGTITDADMAGLQVRLVRLAYRYVREEVTYGLGRMLPDEIKDLPAGFFKARFRLYKLDIVELEERNYRHHLRGCRIPEGVAMHALGVVDIDYLSSQIGVYWMCRLQELAKHHGQFLGVAVHPAACKFVELMGSMCRLMRGEEFYGSNILESALEDWTLPGHRFDEVFTKYVKEPELRDAFLSFGLI